MAIRPMVRAAVIGAAALGCAALVVPAANASGTLQVRASCESGGSAFTCFDTISGGTTPYTVTWTGTRNAIITRASDFLVQGTCRAPFTFGVRVTVRDAAGATTFADVSQACIGGPPV
jgi:hypothetical protein